jgi:redox-sensitive bicupin YhaK (pirin superfamily)
VFTDISYHMNTKAILTTSPLGFAWETIDPFLFCVHHLDAFPAGNDELGPAASLQGRNLGQDFTPKDGWRMYHGERVPGFPAHPHRGFETVTVVLKGLVDHSDSHGAAGRYGNGDVQWMTAGSGLQHAEMFPLLNKNSDNPLELFQIWLNLPKSGKFAAPHYAMLWAEDIPVIFEKDKRGNNTELRIIAGNVGKVSAPPPAPDSWAADPQNEVAIWIIRMEPGATWTLPPASAFVKRMIFYFQGPEIKMAGENISSYHSAGVDPGKEIIIENGKEESRFLLLQGRPINEPVVQHGPFVMNDFAEIQQAMQDYRRTEFGGWPWNRYDPVHPRDKGRFAKYADGREENRETSRK